MNKQIQAIRREIKAKMSAKPPQKEGELPAPRARALGMRLRTLEIARNARTAKCQWQCGGASHSDLTRTASAQWQCQCQCVCDF